MIKPFRGLLLVTLLPTLATANSFNGYECTEDCSGHEAGYEWAEKNEIDDVDDCDSKSDSFTEGCISYVEEQAAEQEEKITEEEDGEDSESTDWENEEPNEDRYH